MRQEASLCLASSAVWPRVQAPPIQSSRCRDPVFSTIKFKRKIIKLCASVRKPFPRSAAFRCPSPVFCSTSVTPWSVPACFCTAPYHNASGRYRPAITETTSNGRLSIFTHQKIWKKCDAVKTQMVAWAWQSLGELRDTVG